jgi:hypothetical protein
MIVVVGPDPRQYGVHDGFMQRIAAIDGAFVGFDIVHVDESTPLAEVVDRFEQARLIYVHSIYQSKWILPTYRYFAHKIVTDLHGAVPEELALCGSSRKSRRLSEVEAEVFARGRYFIAVTNMMKEHFTRKYSDQAKWIVLPTVRFNDPLEKRAAPTTSKTRPKIIYLGSGHRWQNVDRMVNLINSLAGEFTFTLLTPQPKCFSRISTKAKQHTDIRCVGHSRLDSELASADLGLVLRDDSVVNSVSCPTKLVDYLRNGVVPVVLTPEIGDFQRLGFRYVVYEHLLEHGTHAIADYADAAQTNRMVYRRLEGIADEGFAALRSMAEPADSPSYVMSLAERVDLLHDLSALNFLRRARSWRLRLVRRHPSWRQNR